MEDTAVLSSFDKYTTFSFGGKTLTFRTCDGLERYVSVLTWDDGQCHQFKENRSQKASPLGVRSHALGRKLDGRPKAW